MNEPSPLTDHCGRQIASLRVAVTGRCACRCPYCRRAEEAGPEEAMLSLDRLRELVLLLANTWPLRKIRISGGEPLSRDGVIPFIAALSQALPHADRALTTNGLLLERQAMSLAQAGLNRVNVSMDALDPRAYQRITGGDVDAVLKGLEAAQRAGLHPIKLNCVLLQGWNDAEWAPLLTFALARGFDLRFIELMPTGNAEFFDRAFVPASEARRRLVRSFTLEPEGRMQGSTSLRFKASGPGGEGSVSFVEGMTGAICSDCDRLRLDAWGRVRRCLFAERAFSLATAWQSEVPRQEIVEALGRYIVDKPARPIRRSLEVPGGMSVLGG